LSAKNDFTSNQSCLVCKPALLIQFFIVFTLAGIYLIILGLLDHLVLSSCLNYLGGWPKFCPESRKNSFSAALSFSSLIVQGFAA
jgi:hypothetical protein